MAWRVEFLPAAEKAFGKLDRQHQKRIRKFIEERLIPDGDPRRLGEAYRLVCEIRDKARAILVLAIGDRKDIYR